MPKKKYSQTTLSGGWAMLLGGGQIRQKLDDDTKKDYFPCPRCHELYIEVKVT